MVLLKGAEMSFCNEGVLFQGESEVVVVLRCFQMLPTFQMFPTERASWSA